MTALLLYGDTERSPAMRHEVPLAIGDPFLFAELDGRRVVLTNLLERDRIAAAAPKLEQLDMFELGLRELALAGRPLEEAVREVAVRAALEDVRAAARPGVTGRALYDIACDRFEAAGHATQRTGDSEKGFQFALGHGVGLSVHEPPGLGLAGAEPLLPGDVLAVEPGLWDLRIGGVRYEDLLLVTQIGCETLTDYHYELSPRA
jgi:hypothetical protein